MSRLTESARRTSRRGRAIALLGAVLVLGGAGGGLLGIYEGMVGAQGGARTAWDLATIVGASQTLDGYKVTIERAYADPNLLMLAISVNDLENRGWTQVGTMGGTVTDEQGHEFGQSMGMSTPDGSSAAANLAWFASPDGLAPGQHTLKVSIASVSVRDSSTPAPDESPGTVKSGDSWNPWHEVAGPWTFSITVAVLGGSAADPHGAATVSGMQVRLVKVTVSPATVSGTIAVTGSVAGQGWTPIGQFEHAGRSFEIVQATLATGDAPISFQAANGTSSASGEWTLRIDELVGEDGNQQIRLAGPWVLTFSIP